MANVTTKSIFTSKTFWANVAMFLLTALGALQGIVDKLPFITPEKAASVASGIAFIITLVNIVLRLTTKQPVSLKGGDVKQVPSV